MKKVFYLGAIVLFGVFTFISCENETEVDKTSSENFKLSSPRGVVFAKSQTALKEFILNNLRNKSTKNDIIIEKVKYFENDTFSFGMVNYTNNGEFTSMLVLLELDKDYLIFSDKNGIFINKKEKTNSVGNKKGDLVIKEEKSSKRDVVFNCQGQGCCEWSKPKPNYMHCGCEGGPAVVITTGDGCEVEIK